MLLGYLFEQDTVECYDINRQNSEMDQQFFLGIEYVSSLITIGKLEFHLHVPSLFYSRLFLQYVFFAFILWQLSTWISSTRDLYVRRFQTRLFLALSVLLITSEIINTFMFLICLIALQALQAWYNRKGNVEWKPMYLLIFGKPNLLSHWEICISNVCLGSVGNPVLGHGKLIVLLSSNSVAVNLQKIR